jgi:hypothetical protein
VKLSAGEAEIAARVTFEFLPEALKSLGGGRFNDRLLFWSRREFGLRARCDAADLDLTGRLGLEVIELVVHLQGEGV